MTVSTTTITGSVVLADDEAAQRYSLIFKLSGFDTDSVAESVVGPEERIVDIAEDGTFTIGLWSNADGVRDTVYSVSLLVRNVSNPRRVELGNIYVPTTGGPLDLYSLLAIDPPAGADVDDYIVYLASSVTAASGSASDAAASATEAGAARDEAVVSETNAAASAAAATAAVDDYANHNIDEFDDLPLVTASDVAVGGVVVARKSKEVFVRADDAANDYNLDYSGGVGVKWYAMQSTKRALNCLGIGQSNWRGVTTTTGGDLSIPGGALVWDNNIVAASITDGTQFQPMRIGDYPTNVFDGTDYKVVMPQAVIRELQKRTDYQIYMTSVAKGGHGIEAFIPDALRTANGWSLLSGDTDLSTHLFSNAAAALAAVERGSGFFDVVFIHQGERNMSEGDSISDYRQKLFVLINEMITQGLIHGTKTKIVFGGISDVNSRYPDHKAAITNMLNRSLRQVRYADSRALPLLGDNIHFDANGVDGMAVRMVDAMQSVGFEHMGSDDNGTIAIEVADAETGGNVASATVATTSRWQRSGRTITAFLEVTGIDTTGLTAGNDLWIRGLPFPAWANQPAEGSARVANMATGGGYITAFLGADKSGLRLARSVNSAGGYYLKVSDLTSGSAAFRIGITYVTDT